jgi:hypothetical protein
MVTNTYWNLVKHGGLIDVGIAFLDPITFNQDQVVFTSPCVWVLHHTKTILKM